MRSLLAALAVVTLLAAPSLGIINIQVVADDASLAVGEQTTVRILAQGTDAGIAGLAGDVVAAGDACLASLAGSFQFEPDFRAPVDGAGTEMVMVLGSAAANGGWTGFGSAQTAMPMDPNYGKAAHAQIASYTVTATAEGVVTLSFSPQEYNGWVTVEHNLAVAIGDNLAATITVVPEPMTLALLGLGGLLALRRRSR